MKVIAFNGSPNKEGNTFILLNRAMKKLEQEGIECELVNLSGETIKGCQACMKCRKNQDKKCVISSDIVNDCIQKILEADGVLIGSPTYFATVTPEIKALMDRAGFVALGNNHMFRRKVGAAVAAVRRAGSMNVFETINNFYLISEMIIPGSIYWNMGIGLQPGDVKDDNEGILTADRLGENMAWLIKNLKN